MLKLHCKLNQPCLLLRKCHFAGPFLLIVLSVTMTVARPNISRGDDRQVNDHRTAEPESSELSGVTSYYTPQRRWQPSPQVWPVRSGDRPATQLQRSPHLAVQTHSVLANNSSHFHILKTNQSRHTMKLSESLALWTGGVARDQRPVVHHNYPDALHLNTLEHIVAQTKFSELLTQHTALRYPRSPAADPGFMSSDLEESTVRSERSTNLSHITGTARKIQMFVKNRHLQILPDGTVNGTMDDTSDFTILQRTSVNTAELHIQGVATCLFLCMDTCGLLYGAAQFTEECIFRENIEQDHYNTYSSIRYSNTRRTLYLALDGRGVPRKVQVTAARQKRQQILHLATGTKPTGSLGKLATYARVLTRHVPNSRVEDLARRLLLDRQNQQLTTANQTDVIGSSPIGFRHHGYNHLCPVTPAFVAPAPNTFRTAVRCAKRGRGNLKTKQQVGDHRKGGIKRKKRKRKCIDEEDADKCRREREKRKKSKNAKSNAEVKKPANVPRQNQQKSTRQPNAKKERPLKPLKQKRKPNVLSSSKEGDLIHTDQPGNITSLVDPSLPLFVSNSTPSLEISSAGD